jgi:hypothetical protein
MKQKLIIIIVAAFITTMAGGALAEDMTHDMGHKTSMEKMGHGMKMDNGMAMDHSEHGGEIIHNSEVQGYKFSYRLIDIREKMAAMKGKMPEGMDATNHLMVYIKDSEGKTIEDAKVGYLVEGPDGSTQKLMCMGMGGGYGSDLKLTDSGAYVIKTKAVANGKKLVDEFTYTVK